MEEEMINPVRVGIIKSGLKLRGFVLSTCFLCLPAALNATA
jgi:hypothetical protein